MNTARKKAKKTEERRALVGVTEQLAALGEMTVSQLAGRYEELFGEPARSRNKLHLRKKIAWRIQELAEGGLSDRALARIEELAGDTPLRWPSSKKTTANRAMAAQKKSSRDPRLPPVGGCITRVFGGVEHRVTVREEDFEYGGEIYKSLSRVARLITGTNWNGFLFFRLESRGRKQVKKA